MIDDAGHIIDKTNEAGFVARTGQRPSGAYRVAQLLLVLGKEQAVEVLKRLSPDEVERVAVEVAKIESVDGDEAREVLADFDRRAREGIQTIRGGAEAARAILCAAFGDEKAEDVLSRAGLGKVRPLAFLQEIEASRIVTLLKGESPYVAALILSQIDAAKAASVLSSLPPAERVTVAGRVATMGSVDGDVLRRVADTLKERIRTHGTVESEEVDGKTTLAEILRRMPHAEEQRLIDSIGSESESLAEEIRERLFTLDTLLRVDDGQLQTVLRLVDDNTLALALKGKSVDVRRKVLENLSTRRREIVAEEYRLLGPRPRGEVDEATGVFVGLLRAEVEAGRITLRDETEEYV